MIATILPCERCNRVDLTGELPATKTSPGIRLCVNCYAQSISDEKYRANPKAIRFEMKQQLIRIAEQGVPKAFIDKSPDLV
jgi:hypothetical protein